MEEKQQHNLTDLKFSVTGKQVTVDNSNINQPLKVAVKKALERTGTSRPIEEYDVLLNNEKLDINLKIEDLKIPADAVIFVSLKTGQGGK